MFQSLYATSIFLSTVILKIVVSDPQSLSNENCVLLNTCSAITTDYLASERSKTPKTKSNTQSTSHALDDSTPLPKHTQLSLGTKKEPLKETTSSSYTSLDAKSYTTSPLTTATKVTTEVAEEFTTVDALKSTQDSETSKGYTIPRVSEFKPVCYLPGSGIVTISVMDFIYVLCISFGDPVFAIQAYDTSIPHDLLMITVNEGSRFLFTRSMVGIEKTLSLYVSFYESSFIWKIDLVNNTAGKWLSGLYGEFYMSVANERHLLLLRVSDDVSHLDIYDEDSNLVRNVSLSKDFRVPLRAIQKPNGEFIVSHRSKEDNSMCVSFLSIEGEMIDQFKLRETGGFRDAKVFYSQERGPNLLYAQKLVSTTRFAIEVFSGNVYIIDFNTEEWNLADCGPIFSNSSDLGSQRKIVGVQCTDGRTFTDIKEDERQFVELFYDTDDGYLFLVDNIFYDLYQFDTNTLKGRQLGLHIERRVFPDLCYSAKKNQFIFPPF